MRAFESVLPWRGPGDGRLVGLLATALLVAAAGPAGAQPEAPPAVVGRLPSGGDAYLEIRDLGAALERLGRSSAMEAARALWSGRESAPLRIAGGVAQGVSGLSPAQMLAALDGCQIVAGRYAAGDAGLVVVRGESPGLRRLLSVFERFAAPPEANRAPGIEPALASRPSRWVVRQEPGFWIAASSSDLAARAAAPRDAEPPARPPAPTELRRELGRDQAWLWWTEGGGFAPGFFDGLERWLGPSGAGWTRTREQLERAGWNAASLRLADVTEPAEGLRVTLRLLAPGSETAPDRWISQPTSPAARKIGEDELAGWEDAARTLAASATRLEVRRREGPLVELAISLVFAPLPEETEENPAATDPPRGAPAVSPRSTAGDSSNGSRVPPDRRPRAAH